MPQTGHAEKAAYEVLNRKQNPDVANNNSAPTAPLAPNSGSDMTYTSAASPRHFRARRFQFDMPPPHYGRRV
jgi:hypothetical protein